MVKFRHLLAALFVCSTLATVCAFAQTSFTQIRDVVTNSNGTPFNGMVVITWNGYSAPGGTPVSQLSASAKIYNGALSVLLVPTTTAAAGTYYSVVYTSSDGTVTWTETWQVPPSTTALTIAQVRQSTTQGSGGSGGSVSSGQYATLPISISQITGLSADITSINSSITTLNTEVSALGATSITALTNTVNTLSGTVSGLSTTVTGLNTTVSGLNTTVTGLNTTVTGLSSTVSGNSSSIATLNTSLSGVSTTVTGLSSSVTTLNTEVANINAQLSSVGSSSTNASFVDAAAPSGTLNGTNAQFTLASAPAPATSLGLYRNGLLQMPGVDFTLSGTSITFIGTSIPQVGDIVQAYYRKAGSGGATASFVDAEAPGGTVNGTNLAFTLANAPNPSGSLKLYKNGLLMSQNGDYTISGATVTFAAAAVPVTGDVLTAAYRH